MKLFNQNAFKRFDIGLPIGSKIIVAMSGGVDSSAAAAILREFGYNVIGITLDLYDKKKWGGSRCTNIEDAKLVAERMNFEHHVIECQKSFFSNVMEYFADSYIKGETPVPCVYCNKDVKFEVLVNKAKEIDAKAIITGHYAKRITRNGTAELHIPLDKKRDQTYFLFSITKEQLNYLRFPLSNITKDETREYIKHFGLKRISEKKDSFDICFVSSNKYHEVVKKIQPEANTPGKIIHIDGEILGDHEGIVHYTVGQRKGINIGGQKEPLFVIKINAKNQEVIVGPKKSLECKKLYIRDMNWIGMQEKNLKNKETSVRLRSSGDILS